MTDTLIIGAGGGGKGGGGAGHTPTESPDSLRSRAYAQVLDLLSEGEIEGLVDGAKSIYFNGTALQNADGSYNFNNVYWSTRAGTQAQSYIQGSPGVESELAVAGEVKFGVPLTRSITNSNVNAVRVTVSVPQLSFQNPSNGDLGGTAVDIQVQVQTAGGGYVTQISDTISGKASSKYQRSYRIGLTGAGPWDVRVVRVTADSTAANLQNKTWWDSYTEIIDARLRYPNSALVGLRVDASQFQSIPTRAYDVKLLRVRVPSNYNATTRTYTGSWNGTFSIAWTDNPAWCFYDLVTSSRYGLGAYLNAAQVDKWALYTIAKYCDELVPNGFGGVEPRFTCNLYLQTREEAYKVVRDLASSFRAMAYWSSGALTCTQDAPADPVALYTQANVVGGTFTYAGASARARHTVALVTWNDPEDFYRQKVEYTEDATAIARFGVVPTEVVAVGCTSRGQAARLGRWILYAERYESETVSFSTGIEGAVARPGDIIKVADASRAGKRMGGRVKSATLTTVTLDANPDLGAASWTLFVQLTDGSVVSRAVSSAAGVVMTLASALPSTPAPQSAWVLSASTLEAQTFRVIAVTERDGGVVEITALRHNASKYAAVETGLKLETRTYTNLSPVPGTPTGLTLTESLYKYQAEVRAMVTASWQPVSGATSYRVMWRKDGGNFSDTITTLNDFEIRDITPGLINVRVISIGPTAKPSATYAETTITAYGKTAPPADVTGFTTALDANIGVTLVWNKVADLDVDVYEVRSGASWAAGAVVGQVKGTTLKIGVVAGATATWWIKALDTSGSYSTNAVSATATITAAAQPTVTSSFAGENVVLSWSAVAGSLATDSYQVRYGTTWAGGTVLATIKGTSFSTRAQWAGTRTFWVAAVDIAGNVGTPASRDAIVIVPATVTMTQETIDNNVLLKWGDATATLPLDYYELRRGTTWAGATVIGRISSRFTAIFESTGGSYTYWVAGVDIAGNVGATSSVAAVVAQPPDYTLQYNANSSFSGTLTNMVSNAGAWVAPVSTTETWQSHFSTRSWTTPQDQITAGYAYYAMPSQTTGAYEESIDYGTVLAATKISATLTYATVIGSVTVTPTISVRKLATDPWTNYAGVASVYVTDFRYVKVRFDFASVGGDDLINITALNIRFDVKLKNDAGLVSAVSTDVGGTVVNFGVSFVDVSSITLTPKATAARIAVYDFVDAPNPTSFKVLLFDTAGTRVSGDVGWNVKGV